MTNNIQFVLDAVRTSTFLEVQGEKVRKRDKWMEWVLPSSNRVPTVSGPQSQGRPIYNMLTTGIQSATLEEITDHNSRVWHADPHTEAVLRSSSGELNNQSQTPNGEGTSQVTEQAGPDESPSTRS
ncbi:hypothetical protein HHK36_008715 [Tetracentron sinense]|uniref:Uncharacterized protein n=1 Tax=Tetracentron sinense TaxID=13715 RepID=A0A834ZG10_TETSI|nr:hypothetical protein HHK36_008715 [Tetracentron sinense]